jgi:uncharacterized protein (DUF4415 family)
MIKQKTTEIEEEFDENPEWTDEVFARARPAREVIPLLFSEKSAADILKKPGRPKLENPKKELKLRVDPALIAAYKTLGKGWRTRMHEALFDYAKSHHLI